jgi:hypothetical protein
MPKAKQKKAKRKRPTEAGEDLALTIELAEEGDSYWQLKLAEKYNEGTEIPKNEAEAFRWYLAAAEQGKSDAMYPVANAYFCGLGVEQSKKEALKWASRLAYPETTEAFSKTYMSQMLNAQILMAGIYYTPGELYDPVTAYGWLLLAICYGQPWNVEETQFNYEIRQIEIRTNRVVTETLADASFQPPAQFRRIPRAMPDGADNHLGRFLFDDEINGIRPRLRKFGFAGQPAGETKSFGVVANCFEKSPQLLGESLANSRLALVIKVNGLGKFPLGILFNDDPKTHRLARNRFSMSATTSSSGRQRSGCASARSARRSSSAICSGVSSSSNFSRSCSKTSRCSSNGSRFTCSMTCVALMAVIYSVDSFVQAGFFARADSSFIIQPSSFCQA